MAEKDDLANMMTTKDNKKEQLTELVRTGRLTDRIAVLEGVPLVPFLGQDYSSPYFYIGMCRRGETHGHYNYKRCDLHAGEICWLLPEHVLSHEYVSPDYHVLSVFIPRTYIARLMKAGAMGKFQYLAYTTTLRLSPEQFDTMYASFKFLEQLTECPHTQQDELIAMLIHIIAMLGDEFIVSQHPDISSRQLYHEQLFERFYDAVIDHYRESREVAYYADLLCLTPKYFATVIKQTTGIAASEWISRYVIIKAKYLLLHEPQKTIQQIADHFGFSEQSAFARYFKTHVGVTPKEFRENG